MSSAGFTGRVAVITGGTEGIGKAIALALAAQGASAVICCRTAEEQEWPADLFAGGPAATGQLVALRADVGRPDDLTRLVDRTVARFGRLDVLVNNAAMVPQVGPLLEADLAAWTTSLDVNVRAAFLPSQAAVGAWMGTKGIRVKAVAPGVIETEFSRPLCDTPEPSALLVGRNPRRSIGAPEDVAAAVSFLASDGAAYVNGEVLVVDGGATA